MRAHEMTRSPENATPSGTVVQLKSRLHAGEQPGWSASAWTAATAKIASTPHSLRPATRQFFKDVASHVDLMELLE